MSDAPEAKTMNGSEAEKNVKAFGRVLSILFGWFPKLPSLAQGVVIAALFGGGGALAGFTGNTGSDNHRDPVQDSILTLVVGLDKRATRLEKRQVITDSITRELLGTVKELPGGPVATNKFRRKLKDARETIGEVSPPAAEAAGSYVMRKPQRPNL